MARKLFEQAAAASNADAGTYVLFQLARDIAVQGVDGGAAFGAVDAMAERYQIDGSAMKAEVLALFAKKAKTPQEHLVVAEQSARFMEEAAAAGSYPAARRYGQAGDQ